VADDITTQNESPSSATGVRNRFAAFAASSSGRIVVIAIALGVLLVVAGIAAVVVINFSSAGTSTTPPTTSSQTTTSTPAPSDDASAVPAPPTPDSDVFTFRDIFQRPVKKTTAPKASESTNPSAAPGTGTFEPDTLYLQDVTSVNDVQKAVLALNGTTYTLAKGERIPNTPWRVLSVSSSSSTMLYGDAQVVLSVGQGLQQK